MPFIGSVSFHHILAARHDIVVVGHPLGLGRLWFLCLAELLGFCSALMAWSLSGFTSGAVLPRVPLETGSPNSPQNSNNAINFWTPRPIVNSCF